MNHYNLYLILLIILPIVCAIPIQQEIIHLEYPEMNQIPVYSELDQLDKKYNKIINDIFDSNLNDLFESITDTFLTIHELQSYGKEYCKVSLFDFVQLLETELEKSRNNLLISIRFLLETNGQENNHLLNLLFDPDQLTARVIQKLYISDMATTEKVVQLFKSPSFRSRLYHEYKEASTLRSWLNSWLNDIKFTLSEELLV